jgi:hypothetical protein
MEVRMTLEMSSIARWPQAVLIALLAALALALT